MPGSLGYKYHKAIAEWVAHYFRHRETCQEVTLQRLIRTLAQSTEPPVSVNIGSPPFRPRVRRRNTYH